MTPARELLRKGASWIKGHKLRVNLSSLIDHRGAWPRRPIWPRSRLVAVCKYSALQSVIGDGLNRVWASTSIHKFDDVVSPKPNQTSHAHSSGSKASSTGIKP